MSVNNNEEIMKQKPLYTDVKYDVYWQEDMLLWKPLTFTDINRRQAF